MSKMCVVKNRSASRVVYRIPEAGIRREFAPGESKNLEYDELQKLSYQPGGVALMANFLQIQDSGTIQDLGIRTEPEYNMSEKEVVKLLTTGSLDAFLDCLDFAPIGVVDLVKKYAVSLPLTDYEKRKALKDKTGFDVDGALKNIEAEKREDEKPAATTTGRRTQPATEETSVTPGRRTTGSGYKVLNKTPDTEANKAE